MAAALLLASVCWGPAALAEQERLGQLLQRLARGPTVEEVQREALRAAALDPSETRRLVARVRWAGVLPRVEATVDRGLSRDEDLDRTFQEMDELSLATDQDLDFRVVARWDLDRLIYDSDELRARREILYRGQRRRELLLTVTRLYYELLLLRAQREVAGDEASDEDQLEREVRIAELTSMLDGLTGGLISRRGQREVSPARAPAP